MTTNFTSSTLSSVYNDDFDQADNFHQVLFNNGRALQARELTTLQTQVYAELSRLGRNIFKEGAAVSSGNMALNAAYDYIKVSATNAGGDFSAIPIGTVFKNITTGVEARVLEVKPINGLDFTLNTLYIQYINNASATATSASTTFGDNETLFDQSGGGYQIVTHNPNAAGKGTQFNVGSGDFFVVGRFVYTTAQSIILNAYGTSFTGNVGFKVIQEVVSVNDDENLYDNSGGGLNRSAPGADRYRVRLTLVNEADLTSDDTFVFIARIENSTIVEQIEESDAYNKIEELLALRTDEESGDYIVKPFTIGFEDQVANDSSLELIVSDGLAFVNGFRAQNPSSVSLTIPRPVETELVTNDVVPITYGNYFLASAGKGLPDLTLSEVNLYATAGGTGTVQGTARIRGVEQDGAFHRIYVVDLDVDSDKDLSLVRSIGTSLNDYFDLVLTGDNVHSLNTIDNDLLMPTSRPRSESLSDITLSVQRYFTTTSNGSGEIDLNAELGAGESFSNTDRWNVGNVTGSFTAHTVTSGVISGLSVSTAYEIHYFVQKTAAIKTKTVATTATTFPVQTAVDAVNGNTYNYYDLLVPDIYSVDSVRIDNGAGDDILGRFILDDGQRDNYYADGRLILDGVDSAPSNIYVNFQHFNRGGAGDFYAPSSYSVPYPNIPTHILQDGSEISLIDYIDFRPDKNDGTFSNLFSLPKNSSNITADISYYLPRADKLLITEEGDVQVLMGQQAENPQFKPTPNNTLELFKIVLNGNTMGVDDLSITPIENKGYTMKDIAGIEAKVDALEEYTNEKFLEIENKINQAFDSDGVLRTSIALQIDDCSDHTQTDTQNPDHRASLDPESRLVRPLADEDNIRLLFDGATSQGVSKIGDNVYLQYDSATWQTQGLASKSLNVNPFGMVDNVGTLKLSPSSDEWKESKDDATYAVQGDNKIDRVQAYLWNNWVWNWNGRSAADLEDLDYGALTNKSRKIRTRSFLKAKAKYQSSLSAGRRVTSSGRFVSRVLVSQTIRRLVNGRYIDLALIPWMRSRKVYFHAKGLTPNTKFTPFFDGKQITDWCREEVAFVQWSDRTEDIGNKFKTISGHPDGSSELTSDANGEVIGSFFIPNQTPLLTIKTRHGGRRIRGSQNSYLRFRTGTREFRLLDITRNDWSDAGSKAFAYYGATGQVDKSSNGFWSLRGWNWVSPWNMQRSRSAYTPKELRTILNRVTSLNLGILNPQLSGKWGPITVPLSNSAIAGLDATGEMSQILSDYISVDNNNYAGTTTNVLSLPQNPMAQTFKVANQFGVVLTKLDLYFRTKDTGNIPISIHLRPVVGGKPSTTTIVPDSHVFLNPSDVIAVGTNPQLSTIASTPTAFVFDEPIYLEPNTTYAIVVSTQSTQYELFSAKTGERVFGSTSRSVTTQPAPGSLYLPQNGQQWIESKDQDLMFKLTRAKFNTGGGSLVLKNAGLENTALDDNPVRTYNGTGSVYVKHMCHGLIAGDKAQLSGCVDVNGVTAVQLNDLEFTIDSVDLYGYTVTTTGTATSNGYGGGNEVLSKRNAIFSVVNPSVETAIPKWTSVDVSAKWTSGKYISGTGARFVQQEQWSRITPNQNVDFHDPKTIYNVEAELDGLGAGVSSAYVKVDFKTSSDYVSPIVDLQRTSLILVGYCMDDPTVTPYINGEADGGDTQPYGSATGFQHITTPVTLEDAAVGIDARLKVNLPNSAGIKFFYRTASSDEDIYDKAWTAQEARFPIVRDNSPSFIDAEFLVGNEGGTMKTFNQSQIKLTFTAGNLPPKFKDLSINYLAT